MTQNGSLLYPQLFTLSVLGSCPHMNATEPPEVVRSMPTSQGWVQILTPAIISSETQSMLLDHFMPPFTPRAFVRMKGKKVPGFPEINL